ncbi:hypothetical protein C8J57DRAFT_1659882 [Mycena rebaudengoi]|nr:hypothetical protein C8J57DRAFT_1659882 [Mycena rebaudengoi]
MENAILTRSASKARQSNVVASSPDTTLVEIPAKRKIEPESTPDPSSKRAKNAPQPSFEKHGRFWALDGNVILQFGQVAFKVHRSRLSTQSVWFEKLFERRAGREGPLDAHEEDIKDVVVEDLNGCDVYYLQDIGTKSDFEALLTAMEDSIPSVLTVAAIYRAACQFNFPKFLDFAELHLKKVFSEHLADFRSDRISNPAAAVTLGKLYNFRDILKRAWYEIACQSPRLPQDPDEGVYDGLALLLLLANAQKYLMSEWLSVSSPASDNCPSKNPCAAAGLTSGWKALTGTDDILHKYRYDPITGLTKLIGKCANAKTAWFTAKREEIWSELDTWFDIPVQPAEDEQE